MNNDRIMFARMLNLDYLNSFDQNQLDLSKNDVTKNINNLVVTMEDNKVHLKWNDCVNTAWKKAYIVKAENSIPTSVFNGNIIASYTEKNKYSTTPFIDDQVNENVLYCYRVFYEFENATEYYSGFKNLFYVYVAGVTICSEEHGQGPVFAKNVVTDPLHRFVSDSQIELWTNKSKFDGDYNHLTNKPDVYTKSEVYSKTESYSKEQINNLLDTIKTAVPQGVSGIYKYIPDGATNGDCQIVATKRGVTFRKENNKAILTVPEGTEILSIQVRFSAAEVGTSGKVIIRYGENYNFENNMFVPTYSLIQDLPANRVYKLGQAATFGTEPNELQLVGLSANIGVIAKLTF